MTYDELSKRVEQLSYRDKFRLAQLLIQLARKEEEEQKPVEREATPSAGPSDPELILYVAERLKKLRPARKETVLNSIGAMFQFRGGITEEDKETIFVALIAAKEIVVAETGKVTYPDR